MPGIVYQTARIVAGLAVNKNFDNEKSALLMAGIRALQGHLISTDFNVRHAAVAAGKAALLATMIKRNISDSSFDKFRFDKSKVKDFSQRRLKNNPDLSKLMEISPEAYHYWITTEMVEL